MSFILDALRKAEHTKSEHQSLKVPSPTILTDELPARPRNSLPSGLLWVLPGMLMLAVGIWALLPMTGEQGNQRSRQAQQVVSTKPARSAQDLPTQEDRTAAQGTSLSAAPTTPQSGATTSNGSNVATTSTAVRRRNTGARALDQVARQGQLPRPQPPIELPRPPHSGAATALPLPTRSSAPTKLPRPVQGGSVTALGNRPRSNITPGTVTIAPEGVDLSDDILLNRPTTLPSPTIADNQSRGSVNEEVLPEYRSVLIGGKVPLPEISLDMHVYSSTPAKRFVFVNLNKLGEGERLEDGTSIEEILPDGAVLNHKGFRFIIRPD